MSEVALCTNCGANFERAWGEDRQTCNDPMCGVDRDLTRRERSAVASLSDVVVTNESVVVDPESAGMMLLGEGFADLGKEELIGAASVGVA